MIAQFEIRNMRDGLSGNFMEPRIEKPESPNSWLLKADPRESEETPVPEISTIVL